MEEIKLHDWERSIKVLFGQVPQLEKLITNPVYHSAAAWAGDAYKYFQQKTGGVDNEDFYRVVFKQGSPKSLMAIGSGELSSLKTTSVVERGRIVGVAGLELVDVPATSDLLPFLLTMGMFGAIQHHLGYISNVCADIRNRQILGDHAKLERISEVILDCFESIPEMDQDMVRLNLARIVSNTDECLELLIIMREDLMKECESKLNPLPPITFDDKKVVIMDGWSEIGCYEPDKFMRKMLVHNVFAAYERFVAGKVCQIVLSGNYSESNIERSKQSIIRAKDSIRKVFKKRIEAHKAGAQHYENNILKHKSGDCVDEIVLQELEHALSRQVETVAEIERKLDDLLDAKLESFDFLSRLANRDEIDVYLINDTIVIDKRMPQSLPSLSCQ